MTPGTKIVGRNNSGLLVPSFPSDSITSPSLCVLNRLESGSGSVTVSLKKMIPTRQALSKNREQMAQGRK